jgi:hypothetical protein
MSFEDRLLAELKAEVAVRAARRPKPVRRWTGRWYRLAGAAVAMIVTATVVPLALGSQPAAYAVTRNPDGSITVTIKEFRAAGRLEKELADDGARTDITYLPQHMRCAGDSRGVVVFPPQPTHPPKPPRHPLKMSALPKAYRDMFMHDPLTWAQPPPGNPNVFKIFPQRIGRGRTLVLELAESHRTRLWKLSSYVVSGPVKPCVFENDPYWN